MQLVWTGIWADLEAVEVEKEEGNGRNDKRKLKNQIFPFRMIMRKFCITMRNGPEGRFVLQDKENFKADFAWSCENFAQSCEMLQKDVNCCCCIFNFAQSCEIAWALTKWSFYY